MKKFYPPLATHLTQDEIDFCERRTLNNILRRDVEDWSASIRREMREQGLAKMRWTKDGIRVWELTEKGHLLKEEALEEMR